MEKKIGPYLKQMRKESNLTLRSVEKKTGISNAYLSQLENDKITNPSPSTLHKLADCYKISYGYLMELVGYPLPINPMNEEKRLKSTFRFGSNQGNLTEDEEKKLLEYLEFLRSKRDKK